MLEPGRRSRGQTKKAEGASGPQGLKGKAEAKAADPKQSQLIRPLAFSQLPFKPPSPHYLDHRHLLKLVESAQISSCSPHSLKILVKFFNDF